MPPTEAASANDQTGADENLPGFPVMPPAAAPPGATPAQQASAPGYPYPYPYPYAQPYPAAGYPYGYWQAGQPAAPPTYGQPGAYPSAPSAYANGNAATPSPAPGYPAYPQGVPTTYAPYPPPSYSPAGYAPYGYPAYGYAYPYGYPAYYYPMSWRPPRAPGETHALVVSWMVTVLGGLSILCGLLAGVGLALVAADGAGAGLATFAVFVELTLGPILAGGFALYYGIRGILRKPSPRFGIPHPILFLILTAIVLGAGVVLWHLTPTPGSTVLILPLVFLAGILPALAILAFTARRLGLPSTRRHVWMSLLYGLTLAPLLAFILEAIAILLVARFSGAGSAALGLPTNTPSNPLLIIVLLLTVSFVAPVVEEGVKPLGAVLLMRRLRSPASAFLLGMAAGVGFDIFETIGYIGQGQADWITIAIERVGAGLLHGVGAGMAALGWYYLINGKGVSYRWARGIGCILYAVLQHAVFNGIFVVTLVPGLSNWLSQSWYIGRLPFQNADFLDFALYVIILGVLYTVTGRLARGTRPPATTMILPESGPPAVAQQDVGPATVGSSAR